MEAEYEIRDVTDGMLQAVATNIRPIDDVEARAMVGMEPLEAMRRSVAVSSLALSLWLRGELAGVWGVVTTEPRKGTVWLITTEVVARRKSEFKRACCDVLARLLQSWDELENRMLVDPAKDHDVRWWKRMGFRYEHPEPYGPGGREFVSFRIHRKDFNPCAYQPRPSSQE